MTHTEVLGMNWRPIPPFRDRWEPLVDIAPIGEYPIKRFTIPARDHA